MLDDDFKFQERVNSRFFLLMLFFNLFLSVCYVLVKLIKRYQNFKPNHALGKRLEGKIFSINFIFFFFSISFLDLFLVVSLVIF